MKHEAGQCPLCDFKLKQAHDTLREWFLSCVKPEFPDCHISWSFRGQQDQMTFFKDGTSGVPWPRSKHNKMDAQSRACSEALDLFLLHENKALFPPSFYRDIEAHTEKSGWGDRIKCGLVRIKDGKKTTYDRDHFELRVNQNAINRG
jgi:hypothetical protein